MPPRSAARSVAPDRLIIYNRERADEKAKEFRYPEGIYLSSARILQDDLLSIRRVFIAAAKLIFARLVQPVPLGCLVCIRCYALFRSDSRVSSRYEHQDEMSDLDLFENDTRARAYIYFIKKKLRQEHISSCNERRNFRSIFSTVRYTHVYFISIRNTFLHEIGLSRVRNDVSSEFNTIWLPNG